MGQKGAQIWKERIFTTDKLMQMSQFYAIMASFNLLRIKQNHKMEKLSFQQYQDQKITFPSLNQLIETYTERIDSATQISSNQHVDGGNGICEAFHVAPVRQAPEANEVWIKNEAWGIKQEQMQNPHRIILEGYIEKSTQSFFNRWQMCYCVLSGCKLYFFEDHMRVKMNSCINLSVHASKIQREGLLISLKLDQYEEPICFKAYFQRQAHLWVDCIGSIIRQHINSSKIAILQSKKNIYLQKDALLQRQFLEIAETGDILLMTTTDTHCAIQRFVTNSEYDHIAMVVKFNGEVKIFQSNADEGVSVYNWAQFQACFHQYEKISFRKLHYQGRGQSHSQLTKFIKSSVGKKYELGAVKLMRKSSDEEEKRGYFCSQLVAKVYKMFGLLSSEKASSNYWPVDFTMRGGMNLLKQASLASERLIILNKHLKYNA